MRTILIIITAFAASSFILADKDTAIIKPRNLDPNSPDIIGQLYQIGFPKYTENEGASGNLVGRVPRGWHLQASRDPVCHRSEVLESAISPSSTPSKLKVPVDGFYCSRCGEVFVVSHDPFPMPFQCPPKLNKGFKPRALTP